MNTLIRRRAVAAGLAAAALCAATPALAQKKYDPGVSDTEIVLGMTMPLSGPASGYAVVGKSAEAYFKKLNDEGGINGRKVRIVMYDDQYSPPRTVEMVRKLVEQDQVFALFASMGTASNAAIQRYMNMKKVPQLFIQSGAAQFNDAKKNPWTVPTMTSLQGEGRLYARHIIENQPDAKVAVLMQNDDLGREIFKGLQEGLQKQQKVKVVAQATYEVADPTVDSQIVQLKASGADVLLIAGTARTAAQAIRKAAEIGWTPERYVNYAASSIKLTFQPAGVDKAKGVIGLAFYKDPGSARWSGDAELRDYQEMVKTHGPGVDPTNGAGVAGYITAQLMAHVLREAGNDLTRENVLRLASNIKSVRFPMMLPDTKIENSPTDLFAFAVMQPVRFNGAELDPIGPALSTK